MMALSSLTSSLDVHIDAHITSYVAEARPTIVNGKQVYHKRLTIEPTAGGRLETWRTDGSDHRLSPAARMTLLELDVDDQLNCRIPLYKKRGKNVYYLAYAPFLCRAGDLTDVLLRSADHQTSDRASGWTPPSVDRKRSRHLQKSSHGECSTTRTTRPGSPWSASSP